MILKAGLAATGEWECMECGYIEEGAKTKRPKVCPDCGAPGQALEFFPFGDDDEEGVTDAWASEDGRTSDNLDDDLVDDGVDLDSDEDVR